MDPQLAAAVKEEILRNVMKTHRRIMLAGWDGTGKTVAALKAGKGLYDVCYFNAFDADAGLLVAQANGDARVLGGIRDFSPGTSEQPLLIIDGADKVDDGLRAAIADILADRSKDLRVLLITRVLVDVKDFLPGMDVVVRFKQDTAEVLLTTLYDLDTL